MLTYDKCEKCVHNEVCNRKKQFVTTINDLAELRVAVGDLLPLGLEQMEMTVNVRCKHYDEIDVPFAKDTRQINFLNPEEANHAY